MTYRNNTVKDEQGFVALLGLLIIMVVMAMLSVLALLVHQEYKIHDAALQGTKMSGVAGEIIANRLHKYYQDFSLVESAAAATQAVIEQGTANDMEYTLYEAGDGTRIILQAIVVSGKNRYVLHSYVSVDLDGKTYRLEGMG